jgi:hypothetical protein
MTFLSRNKFVVAYLLLALSVVAAFIFIEVARRERVQQLNVIAKEQCEEIEKLKLQNREEAREDYRRLDETLELLKLERTDQIVRRAKLERDGELARNRAESCPRHVID